MEKFWQTDEAFHREMETYEGLLVFRRNISTFINQLKYFFNIKKQILKMEDMFQQPENYE